MTHAKYPLKQLVRIKQRRLEEAERALKQKKEQLRQEQEKQQELERARNETFNHKEDKIIQLREEMDKGTTSDKIEIARDYIKVVFEELQQREKKVEKQTQAVTVAKQQVEGARKDLIKKQQDIEKLAIHRKEWNKEMKALEEHNMSVETDEIGNAMHNIRKTK